MSLLDQVRKETEDVEQSRIPNEPIWNVKESSLTKLDQEMDQLDATVQLIDKYWQRNVMQDELHYLVVLLRDGNRRLIKAVNDLVNR